LFEEEKKQKESINEQVSTEQANNNQVDSKVIENKDNQQNEEKPVEKKHEEPIEVKDKPKHKDDHQEHKVHHHEAHHHHQEKNKDDEEINFSEIKNKTISFFKNLRGEKDPHEKKEKSDSKEINIINFTKKNSKWLIPLVFILIAIFISSFFRMAPSSLPITDKWAEDSVYRFYRNGISDQINQQYPNLPQQNREALIEKEFQKNLEENKERIKAEVEKTSQQFKANFQDQNGDTYLLAIDPYLWYSEARNVVNYGHLGNKIIDGESYFTLRDGRFDKDTGLQLHPYIAAYLYKFLHFFNKDISIMRALFLLPAILIALALIPTFFIGRRITGNVGGLFAALFLAVNGPLLSRTPAGFSDTDPYNILMPLLITWLFIEAYHAKDNIWKGALTVLSGFFVGAFSAMWGGWSFAFLFVLATIFIIIGFKTILVFIKNKTEKLKTALSSVRSLLFILGVYLVSSALFITLFQSFRLFWKSFIKPIQFMTLKEVGIKSIWPNVLTTVAEFNTISFNSIINQMGGKLLFALAIVGLIFLIFRKDEEKKPDLLYFVILIIWFSATAYAFTKGARFAILMAPAFALALGSFFGIVYEKSSKWITRGIHLDKRISQALVIAVFLLFLITPITTAQSISRNEIPSMNDAWYNTLIKVKDNSADAIITSWWDFGHWFVAISERRVTFDGGDQGERIHWVGKTLISSSEEETNGILRMLNCAQEAAPHKLDEFTDDSLESVNILYKIFPISDRNEAKQKYLELGLTTAEAEVMLEYTHCQDLIDNYYITSQDMIGKAGVWGHFGSWNFEKAIMYQTTKKLSRIDAVSYLTKNFDLTEERADQIHHEIQTTKGDQWIAPWPGYLSGQRGCDQLDENTLRCVNSVQGNEFTLLINLKNFDIEIENNPGVTPNSLVYADKNKINDKKFSGKKTGFSVLLIPDGDKYTTLIADPLQAAGTFSKLFFFNGHGMKCFEKFDDVRQISGGRIISWKIDFDCKQDNKVFFLEEST